ncbi:hypothetical protein AA14337_2924 [Acetobacter malorum DSM 14337]|uniref:Phage protein n=1 Tax=Acetobacter malorum DSM 14337 TaxID=1307910 RepID=A0ABQ0PYN4_9PROT|nr:hypothetical protein [Acetobacter malorum]KXV06773.1 hypothetical protein AD930_06650 [Acetobacter malorum]GBQ84829.1 hypothetical protein AA14337_2924 [Acetobacter malorum DSM 14337]
MSDNQLNPHLVALEQEARELVNDAKRIACKDFAALCKGHDNADGHIISLAYLSGSADGLPANKRPTIGGMTPDAVGIAVSGYEGLPPISASNETERKAELQDRLRIAGDIKDSANKLYEKLIGVADSELSGIDQEELVREFEQLPCLCAVIRSYAYGEYPQVDLDVPGLMTDALLMDMESAAEWTEEMDGPSPV